jgi:hypothetical protein
MGPDLRRPRWIPERRDAPPQLRQRQRCRLTGPLIAEFWPQGREQIRRFRRESKRAAWGGDLVFFHVDSDANSYVYHVAIYEGGNRIVSAIDEAEGIGRQTIWSPDVTFGTITH